MLKQDQTVAEVLEELPCFGGLDLAKRNDIAAFALVWPFREEYYFSKGWYWVPDEEIRRRSVEDGIPYNRWKSDGWIMGTPGEVIDYEYVFETIKGIAKKYKIQEVGYDEWEAVQISQQMEKIGLEMIPIRQGYKSLSPPTRELDKLVRSGRLFNDQNPVTRWSMENLIVQEDPAGNIKPNKKKSEQKTDPVVALIMALDRAVRYVHAGDSGKSKYEEEGASLTTI